MRVPSTAALLVLSGLCFDQAYCLGEHDAKLQKRAAQDPLRDSDKAKFQAACPAYEHYARFAQ